MVTLSIKADFKEVNRQLNTLSDSVQRKVIPAALNKVAAKAKSEMTRAITSEFNIKNSEVNGYLRIIPAKRNVSGWFAVLDPFASDRRSAKPGTGLNLIRFVERKVTLFESRRRKKAGKQNKLFFKIKKTGGLVTLRGAFIATSRRTGGTAVFTRIPGTRMLSRKGNTKHSEALQAKQTIDIPQMFNTRRINARVIAKIRQELPIEIQRAISAVLSGNIR